MNPWLCALIVVRNGSHFASERQSLSRDVARGLLVRVRLGVYVAASAWAESGEIGRHIIRMRAFDAVSTERPIFSHWSAAVLLALTFSGRHLDRIHVTAPGAGDRAPQGVASHSHALERSDVVEVHGLLCTGVARTVIDVAGASPFNHGVTIADSAMHLGTTRGS